VDQLQLARGTGTTVQPQSETAHPQPAPAQTKTEAALGLIEAARVAIETAKKTGGQTWTQSLQKRLTAKRIADNLKKNQAEHVNLTAGLDSAAASAQATAPAA
jgi:hypothetical protein